MPHLFLLLSFTDSQLSSEVDSGLQLRQQRVERVELLVVAVLDDLHARIQRVLIIFQALERVGDVAAAYRQFAGDGGLRRHEVGELDRDTIVRRRRCW